MDKCREEFEKWFMTTQYFCDYFTELDLNLNHRNEYENEIINSAWLAFQHQQAKVEELQEEFAEDERFLKEQIQQKDLETSNLKYLQGMDKELIQSLQGKSEKLQKRVDAVLQILEKGKRLQSANYLIATLEQALEGEV
ncbi:hypothetical protein EA756_08690 [Acinetobacter lactucae]|uniref:Uncharacterized protein n=1 Tax=Acinetobacter lactucae TaxID=1785128 RepID=A0A3R9QE32_9GAMM|nr:hypothetical protein [Acinetobacter lactucae]RSO57559.1 hypothetical protein EA756_08690 [Acinetobacter lactucae]